MMKRQWLILAVVFALAACGERQGNVEAAKTTDAAAGGVAERKGGMPPGKYEDAVPGGGYSVVLQAKDDKNVGAHIQYKQCLRLNGPHPVSGDYKVIPVNCPGAPAHEWKPGPFVATLDVASPPTYLLEPLVGGSKHTTPDKHDATMVILETDAVTGAPSKIKMTILDAETGTLGHHAGSAHMRY
jgi:hypothetical protein